jgi:uncharacterized NAD-dependent epimerase/dehydratase family protein
MQRFARKTKAVLVGREPGNLIPRIVIAGTHGGLGKTAVAIPLRAALVLRGCFVRAAIAVQSSLP